MRTDRIQSNNKQRGKNRSHLKSKELLKIFISETKIVTLRGLFLSMQAYIKN